MIVTEIPVQAVPAVNHTVHATAGELTDVNMRMDTILRICRALHVTPDEIFTEADEPADVRQEELLARLEACSPRDRETALELLSVFLRSLDR